jgi:hypothetical protein
VTQFIIKLEPMHGDGIRSLKSLLKHIGRYKGLRAVDAREVTNPELRPHGQRRRGAHSPHHDETGEPDIMNTAVQTYEAHLPVDDGWAGAADEEAERLIKGSLLRFHDWRFLAGKQATVIHPGTQLIALGTVALWQRWEGGKIVEVCVRAPGKLLPPREDLEHLDAAKWEKDANGMSRDPWQNTRLVYFAHPVSAAMYTFSTSSGGGRSAVSALAGAIKRMRTAHPNAVPVVELRAEEMRTKFGLKSKPAFDIVGWKGVPEASPAPPQITGGGDHDDQPPFDID